MAKGNRGSIRNSFIWVVSGRSESGDNYPDIGTYHKAPNKAVLRKLAFEYDGDSDEPTGPGDFGSCMYLTVTKSEVKY